MLSANEILEAVKRGGIDKWQPGCEANQKEKQRATAKLPSKLENDLNALYEAIGNDQLTASQWAQRVGCRTDLIRHRADILIRRKLIKRSTGLMPFVFFRT